MSAWGKAWGKRWGNRWGAVEVAPQGKGSSPGVIIQPYIVAPKQSRTIKLACEASSTHADLSLEFIPLPVRTVTVTLTASVSPSKAAARFSFFSPIRLVENNLIGLADDLLPLAGQFLPLPDIQNKQAVTRWRNRAEEICIVESKSADAIVCPSQMIIALQRREKNVSRHSQTRSSASVPGRMRQRRETATT